MQCAIDDELRPVATFPHFVSRLRANTGRDRVANHRTVYRHHAAAASDVLSASAHYHVEDPLQRPDTPDSLPAYGLNEGETAGIVLANARDVDGFLTDEFAGTNFALIHAALTGPRIVPAPRLICDYARNGHMTAAEARQLLAVMGQHRSWESNPYVQQLLKTLGST